MMNLAKQSGKLNPVLESLKHNTQFFCLKYHKMPGAHHWQVTEAS